MIVSKITQATIYQDAAGGEAIYIRENGSEQQLLDPGSPGAYDLREQLLENKLWGNIRRAAKTNPTIKQALDEAIMLYNLSK